MKKNSRSPVVYDFENLKVCQRGHKYFRTRGNRACPGCAEDRQKVRDFFSKLPEPTRRALERAGIRTMRQLSLKSVKQVREIKGVQESSIPKLRSALNYRGLSFRYV